MIRTLVSKSKDSKIGGTANHIIATREKEVDIFKQNFKSPYEKNLIQHFGMMEHINDYVFSNLGISDAAINHPLIITEPVGNPDYNRNHQLEQFFECYGVKSVFLGWLG